jgi:hypothetical protein
MSAAGTLGMISLSHHGLRLNSRLLASIHQFKVSNPSHRAVARQGRSNKGE